MKLNGFQLELNLQLNYEAKEPEVNICSYVFPQYQSGDVIILFTPPSCAKELSADAIIDPH